MSVRVKVLGGGSKTAVYFEGEELVRVTLLPGGNKVEDDVWDKIKDTDFIKNKLKYDEMTFSQIVEEAVKEVKPKIDMEKAESFVGLEEGKELLADYAKEFGYTLKRNMNIDNMLKDLKEQVEG